jgi:hypothetical protein
MVRALFPLSVCLESDGHGLELQFSSTQSSLTALELVEVDSVSNAALMALSIFSPLTSYHAR